MSKAPIVARSTKATHPEGLTQSTLQNSPIRPIESLVKDKSIANHANLIAELGAAEGKRVDVQTA